ncbi:hypothetical protein [Argonema antarcticum]|uniref:hypothetical protein n=1 Tax=Argonema antarcticum TaxID=2942763 RepID=UPI002012E64B|nr:hypothetical protein [Argonema antarcticum]MCL1474606.1 hypothetical protein [Argonema antarcticum A004/B2]
MSNLKDYKLRFRLLVDSKDDLVMRWLWKYGIRDRYKEFLMPCLKACWLPRALIETQATNKEIQTAAADGVLWLEHQIDYLRKLGGLPDRNAPPVVVMGKLESKTTTTETATIPENPPDISDIETRLGAWG